MRRFLLALSLLPFVALAQTTGTVTFSWTNPTTAVNGAPLTGDNALTKFHLWISNAPIPAVPTSTPVEITAATPMPTQYIHMAQAGSTVYGRIAACNSSGCSDASAQASGVVPWPKARPGAPQNLTLTVQVQ